MELQQLKYFKAVARIGKISDAAEALFVSAPALSTSISRLEKELGVPLFDRTSNRITLNAQGQIFLKYVEQVFSSLENAKLDMQQSLLRQGPHISLAILNSHMWVNLIAAFIAEFSQYTLSYSRISMEGFAKNKLPGHHDFFLAYESEIPPSYAEKLDSCFLFQVTPSVIVHKDHPLAESTTIRIGALAGERLFLPVPGGSLYIRLQQLFQLHDMPFPTDNSYSLIVRQKMVSENKGVSFFSMHPGFSPLPNIRYIPLEDPYEPWNARLYWRNDRPLSDHQLAFKAFVEGYCRELH